MSHYESLAHEVMEESGLNDFICARVPKHDTREAIITQVRITIDSCLNTSDGWKRLYNDTRHKLDKIKAILK